MRLCVAFLMLATLANAPMATGDELPVVDDWSYTLERPSQGWQQSGFDASGWKTAKGGFGTHGTPNARIETEWAENNIWLRKTFVVPEVPARPALLVHHDEDAEIYINGRQVADLEGYTTEYKVVPLSGRDASALRKGSNLLAVHCRQSTGGQFIDVHVIDAEHRPELPVPAAMTKPFKSDMITRWGAEVTADNAWTEYPRPQLKRGAWQNLNGNWDYAITSRDERATPEAWDGEILVPFCLESKLGGVQRLLLDSEALWYHRTFKVDNTQGERTLLNFEAVDYRCEVFVNGQSVGSHQGGNTPFTLDITDAVKAGENTLVVRVEDDTEEWQLRGKQVRNPNGIWYTRVSGIWQTVWLEQVPASYIEDVTLTTDAKAGSITARVDVDSAQPGQQVRLMVKDGEKTVAQAKGPVGKVAATVPGAKLWSPSSPHLYDLQVTLLDANGDEIETVESYAGIRDVGTKRDAQGNLRFTLNGRTIFHWGPLDQGWWPDGLLTPPSDEAMAYDVEFLKAAGFNMIRKHIKVEPRRFYYHCDRLGMMLWQDQVSGGESPRWTHLAPNPTDADWPAEHHQQYMTELEWMIDSLESHPSIVVWVPFNEAWGQHRSVEVANWITDRDPTRLVNVSSGGNFWPAGNIVDQHSYPHPSFPFDRSRFAEFVRVVGEFGGHGYPVEDHLWFSDRRNWGYGGLPKNKQEYRDRYEESLDRLVELKQQGIAGGVYTQTTDVEGEINGLLTYDRHTIKIPAEQLAELHRRLLEGDE